MQRFDLISPRARKDGKTYWLKVGAAFPRQSGGFSLVFDALPLPDAEGRCSVLMVEPREDGQRAAPRQDQARSNADSMSGFGADDSIPF